MKQVRKNVIYEFHDPPDVEVRGQMEFRLVYWGSHVKAAGRAHTRMWEKHQIRRYLHTQLKYLWDTHPLLKFYNRERHMTGGGPAYFFVDHTGTRVDAIAKTYEGFVPVVNEQFGMCCELDILFLRPEPVGKLIKRDAGGGDIDNRMKVLLDALCIPQRGGRPQEEENDPDPNPLYVLLSDDSLITSMRIVADRLLTTTTEDPAEACIVIHTTVKILDPLNAPYSVQP